MDKQKKIAWRKPVLIIFVFIVLSCTIIYFQLSKGVTMTQEEVEQFIGTSLPASATNIQMETQRGLDTVVFIKFDLPPNQVPLFLSDLGFQTELREEYPIMSTAAASGTPSWWLPDGLSNYAAEGDFINGKGYQITVDKNNPHYWTVYLIVSTI